MRRHAVLVDVGRGSIVNEEAVADALTRGRLRAYAADVFAFEDSARELPYTRIPSQLLALQDRALFTPHLGSAVASARAAIEDEAARNIIAVLRGEVPEDAVNSPIQDRPAPVSSPAEENDES